MGMKSDDNVKQKLLDELSKETPMVISTAYVYAKNYVTYGEDITKAWATAVQQTSILEAARLLGWEDGYNSFKSDYENRLKAEREKIAEEVAEKMDYMGSCLNEKNIILGVITGKRETLDSLCSTCKSESCVSNGTAISKADYNARLKADMVAMLTEIQLEIKEQKYRELTEDECGFKFGISTASNIVQQKINSLKAEIEPQESEGKK